MVVFKKAAAQKGKQCSVCGKEASLLSQTLLVCLVCLRLGTESIQTFIESAHHRFQKEITEGQGLQRVSIGDLHLLFRKGVQ